MRGTLIAVGLIPQTVLVLFKLPGSTRFRTGTFGLDPDQAGGLDRS